jgi:NifB/MoaA-like Fe-S oxidoreductase
VPSTNPELRVKMLNNRFAGNVLERIETLSRGGIIMNCQLVLCPGVNNGSELEKTVSDLYKFYPQIQNVAAVPVGITKYREGLYNMKIYDKKTAAAEIQFVSIMQKKYIAETGTPFIRLSDEFYVLAGIDVPQKSFYGDYDQIEDGIGMIRIFRDNIEQNIKTLNNDKMGSFTFITGLSAYEEVNKAAVKISGRNPNIKINTYKIIKEKKIPHLKFGRQIKVYRKGLYEFIEKELTPCK